MKECAKQSEEPRQTDGIAAFPELAATAEAACSQANLDFAFLKVASLGTPCRPARILSTMSVDLKVVLLGAKNVGAFFEIRSACQNLGRSLHALPVPVVISCAGKTSVFNRFIYDEYGKTSMVRAERLIILPSLERLSCESDLIWTRMPTFCCFCGTDHWGILCDEKMRRRGKELQPRYMGHRWRGEVRQSH